MIIRQEKSCFDARITSDPREVTVVTKVVEAARPEVQADPEVDLEVTRAAADPVHTEIIVERRRKACREDDRPAAVIAEIDTEIDRDRHQFKEQ